MHNLRICVDKKKILRTCAQINKYEMSVNLTTDKYFDPHQKKTTDKYTTGIDQKKYTTGLWGTIVTEADS